ncbi:DUF7511 domain-containing protein [Halorubrum sp. DTA46]|uniref:DUF7511 domain-containing protein n=1 Tax=Halorubrum sp. DTA46 TaxID=3402162 RepID=UPI003AAB2505
MSSGKGPDDYDRTDGGMARMRGEASDRQSILQGTVVRYDDRPDECTLHPRDPTDQERTTAWITAKQGAYVSATAWR